MDVLGEMGVLASIRPFPCPSFLGTCLAEGETGVEPLKSALGGLDSATSPGSLALGSMLEKSLSQIG